MYHLSLHHLKLFLFLALSILIWTNFKTDWGFFGHQRINRMAVFTLPPEMIKFYKKHIDYITTHAVDPDKRRYMIEQEAFRHYIDVDHWDTYPFEKIPRKWVDALAKYTDVYVVTENDTLHLFGDTVMYYGEKTLTLYGTAVRQLFENDSITINQYDYRRLIIEQILPQYYEENWPIALDTFNILDSFFMDYRPTVALKSCFAKDRLTPYGILPWHLEWMQRRLTKAFETKNTKLILRYSTDFGHYIGDAHVPLHTTENYNGQLTNQYGIHAFWESRLPELFADDTYDFFVGKADYIDDKNAYFWNIVLESHALLDSVLLIERDLVKQLGESALFCYENRNENTIRTQCRAFSTFYHERLNGMVEARMRAAIQSVGTAWYTAWVDAGQPDLNFMDEPLVLSEKEKTIQQQQEKAVQENKIKGRTHENEGVVKENK